MNTVFHRVMVFSNKGKATDLSDNLAEGACYFRFRRRIAHFALAEIVSLIKASGPLILGVLGPGMVAFVALLCVPLLYACTQGLMFAILLVAAHTIVISIPFLFVNKRTLPVDVLAFFRPLPVNRVTHAKADAAVAWLVLRPLGLVYLLSIVIWLWQFPEWIQGIWVKGIWVTVGSFTATWLLVTLSMQLRWYPLTLPRLVKREKAIRDFPQKRKLFRRAASTSSEFLFWHYLLWLPLWRKDGGAIGRRQTLLFVGALIAIYFWMWPSAETNDMRVGLAIISSTLIIAMTSLADSAFSRNLEQLSPMLASLPLSVKRLRMSARLLASVPAYLALAMFCIAVLHLDAGQISLKIASIYVALGIFSLNIITGLTTHGTSARTAGVFMSVGVLSAIGSELWS